MLRILKDYFSGGMQQQDLDQRLRNPLLKLAYRGNRMQNSDQILHCGMSEHAIQLRMPVHFFPQKLRCFRYFRVLKGPHMGQRVSGHACENSGAI